MANDRVEDKAHNFGASNLVEVLVEYAPEMSNTTRWRIDLRRSMFSLPLVALALAACVSSVSAAGAPTYQKRAATWDKHDTAVYVVSTINLLRTRRFHPVAAVLQHHGVTQYDVYADTSSAGLYFIELRRNDGSVLGTFAYEMGWSRPESVTGITQRISGVQRASSEVTQDYKSDSKVLIGSFSSTLPI